MSASRQTLVLSWALFHVPSKKTPRRLPGRGVGLLVCMVVSCVERVYKIQTIRPRSRPRPRIRRKTKAEDENEDDDEDEINFQTYPRSPVSETADPSPVRSR